jgi:hypothetical protein
LRQPGVGRILSGIRLRAGACHHAFAAGGACLTGVDRDSWVLARAGIRD